jgi:AAA+ ATPase superfamily predicted ATPase
VGEPENFIGRIKELEFLYNWADNIRKKISRSIAFLGRRKIGKSLILERLYIYSEKKGLIPFYYEFSEGKRTGKEFFEDFVSRFYLQVVGYYTRDTSLNRRAVDLQSKVDLFYQFH